MTSEVAPAASGRLSVADQLSGKGPRLIHHPLAVDCATSLTTGLQRAGCDLHSASVTFVPPSVNKSTSGTV